MHYVRRPEVKDREIEKVLHWAMDAEFEPSKFPGMKYEDGVAAAIKWILDTGFDSYNPMEG